MNCTAPADQPFGQPHGLALQVRICVTEDGSSYFLKRRPFVNSIRQANNPLDDPSTIVCLHQQFLGGCHFRKVIQGIVDRHLELNIGRNIAYDFDARPSSHRQDRKSK